MKRMKVVIIGAGFGGLAAAKELAGAPAGFRAVLMVLRDYVRRHGRLPKTLDEIESAAIAMRKNAEAQAGQEKLWGMFWSGLTLGAVLVLFVWLAVRH